MKKLLPVLILAFFFLLQAVYAQNKVTDSLQQVLQTAKEDTNKVNVLNDLSWENDQSGNYDSALYYAGEAKVLAEQLRFKKGIASAYNNIGSAYADQDNYPEALKNYFASLKIYETLGNQRGVAGNYNNIGLVYAAQGNYPQAIKSYLSAQQINEATGNKEWLATNHNNIGNVYINQGNYPEALKSYLASLKTEEALNDKIGIAGTYVNIGIVYALQGNHSEAIKNYLSSLKLFETIGAKDDMANCYNNIGMAYTAQGNYPEALKNHFAALKMREATGAKSGMASSYSNLGVVYAGQGNYPEAIKNYFAALKIFEAIGNKSGIAACYSGIGSVYTTTNRAVEGKKWLQKALNLSLEIGAKKSVQRAYEIMAQADSVLGNYNAALENYKKYILYKDSLYNEDNTKKLTQTTMQYEFDKKQMADSLQNAQVQALAAERLMKQKTYTAMGAGLVVLLLGFSGLVFRNNKKLAAEKQKSENLLHNILPEEISAELKERGATTAKEFDAVTVLFTDFVNFTQAAEQLSPQALVQELHECFTAFDHIIERNGLEKIKTVGDAYLAVCGLPIADPGHAKKAVQAALEIRTFIEERKKQEHVFEIRIGIHSGSVVAGIVGVKKFAYDIWGDTVNTAARMESSGEAGKINISEMTYELVKDDFKCVYRGAIDAKNKGKMDMYFVEKENLAELRQTKR